MRLNMVIDGRAGGRYDESASGWSDGRGPEFRRGIEESPHSIERGAGETPGRSNLPDRATENTLPTPTQPPPSGGGAEGVGDGEKVV